MRYIYIPQVGLACLNIWVGSLIRWVWFSHRDKQSFGPCVKATIWNLCLSSRARVTRPCIKNYFLVFFKKKLNNGTKWIWIFFLKIITLFLSHDQKYYIVLFFLYAYLIGECFQIAFNKSRSGLYFHSAIFFNAAEISELIGMEK